MVGDDGGRPVGPLPSYRELEILVIEVTTQLEDMKKKRDEAKQRLNGLDGQSTGGYETRDRGTKRPSDDFQVLDRARVGERDLRPYKRRAYTGYYKNDTVLAASL